MRALVPALLAPLFAPFALCGQAPAFQWAETVPNVSTPGELANVFDLGVANDGTAYVTGQVNGPRAIVGDFIVPGSFVARYDASGACLWANGPGGAAIAVNGSNEVYVVGTFFNTMQFGASTLSALGADVFVAKYDANGQPLWARQMGGALNDHAISAAVDGLGRVHVGGFFQGTATFGSTTLVATQDTTGFHATYDADGNFQWAVTAGGFNSNDGTDFRNSLACDASGNTIMAGNFDDTGTFGATTITATAFDKMYLARFDASGNCTWAHAMGATYGNEPAEVALAPSGNIYLYAGFWGADATFGGTVLENADESHEDICLAYFNADGDPQWARNVGSSFFNDFPASLDVDDAGNAWVAGTIAYTADFGAITLNEAGTFVAHYDATGTALLAQRPTTAALARHALGSNGGHFVCGNFYSALFDMSGGASVSPALLQGEEGFLAHYDSGLGYEWMRRMGLHGSAFDAATSVLTDADGNVYTTGGFTTTAILCDDTLRAPLAATHLWLNKRDADGNCIWTMHIPCSEPTAANQTNTAASLVMDADGYLYFTGGFFGTADFGAVQLASAGSKDIFLAKYDSDGNCVWAIREGGSDRDEGGAVSVDPNGDLVLTGSYRGNATIAGLPLASLGQSDGFLAKYSADGAPLWAKSFGGAEWDNGYDVVVDGAGSAYLTGRYTTSASFDGLVVNGTSYYDYFLAKYATDGALFWVTGSTGDGVQQSNAVTIGGSGQIYITGQFQGTMTMCTETLVGDPAYYWPFVSCYNTEGAVLWQNALPATGGGYSYAIAPRPSGDIVLAGGFAGTMTVGASTLTAVGGQDAWVAAFNSAGNDLWSHAMIGTDFWDIASVTDVVADDLTVHAVGSYGDVYFTPFDQTGGTLAFDPGDPGSVRFAPNSSDAFTTKFASAENSSPPFEPVGCDGTVQVVEADAPALALQLAPNPVDRYFILSASEPLTNATITVRDVTGRELRMIAAHASGMLRIDAGALPSGLYSISVRAAAGSTTLRFVVEH